MRLLVVYGVQVDSIVTDPPYHLTSIVKRFGANGAAPAKAGATGAYKRHPTGFMGKQWDGGDIAADPETWRRAYEVLKPGGHLIAFGGTRTYHRMVCAIEDAGFEIRDQLAWMFGSGFPKSHDVSKGIDKAAGADRIDLGPRPSGMGRKSNMTGGRLIGGHEQDRSSVDRITAPATEAAREWEGWGTALKPAHEPICLARKPLSEKSVAANVLEHGTGAVNVDGCRIEGEYETRDRRTDGGNSIFGTGAGGGAFVPTSGRWPANVIHDGSDEVVGMFPETTSGTFSGHRNKPKTAGIYGDFESYDETGHVGDNGSAARFFYSAKAGPDDRYGSKHPTVKPVALMRWLVRLVTPPGGIVLDPFAGTGSTGIACLRESMRAILIEREAEYFADIGRRIAALDGSDAPLFSGEPETEG